MGKWKCKHCDGDIDIEKIELVDTRFHNSTINKDGSYNICDSENFEEIIEYIESVFSNFYLIIVECIFRRNLL